MIKTTEVNCQFHHTVSKNYGASCVVKNPPTNAGNAGDVGLILGLGGSPGGGPSNPLESSCLENPMDRGAWQDTVHGLTKSQT